MLEESAAHQSMTDWNREIRTMDRYLKRAPLPQNVVKALGQIEAKDIPAPTRGQAAAILPPSQQAEVLPPAPKGGVASPTSQVVLFEPDDVEQALKIFDANPFDRRGSMLEVMLFSLRIAAINLNVR